MKNDTPFSTCYNISLQTTEKKNVKRRQIDTLNEFFSTGSAKEQTT